MCGIIATVGTISAQPILLDGLKKLEYRGYDSSGICIGGLILNRVRAKGAIANLEEKLPTNTVESRGIAHTRWATHGEPNERNAHPHLDCKNQIAIVHNGIIENHEMLRKELGSSHAFTSETDSEVVAHLLEETLKTTPNFIDALKQTLTRIAGAYGLAVISTLEPETLYVAKNGSPLVIGKTETGYIVASDPIAILAHTTHLLYLDDGEIAIIKKGSIAITTMKSIHVEKPFTESDLSVESAKKNGFPHFMLKEIHEQPEVIRNTIRGRILSESGNAKLGGLELVAERLRELDRIIIIGCGSAYYSGLVGKNYLEALAGIPVEVEIASEFRYRNPIIPRHTAVIAVSQSGETADTLEALKEAGRKGALTLGIVNNAGSAIARATEAGVYNHAGPEIGVASTKAFLSQMIVFLLMSIFLGRQRTLTQEVSLPLLHELLKLPGIIDSMITNTEPIRKLANAFIDTKSCFYLGRTQTAPIAFESALKLKEITYIHAEAYGAGEIKHGPLAMIDETFPSIIFLQEGDMYKKTQSTIEEIRARKGPVIIVTDSTEELDDLSPNIIRLPKIHPLLFPIISVIPMQLFAYYVSVAKGINPDRPRNLAKSVTVE